VDGSKLASREGCFVYQSTGGSGIAVRNKLNVDNEAKTELDIKKGEKVSVDLVRPSRRAGSSVAMAHFSAFQEGSGWLFEKKHGEPMMKSSIPVIEGLWCFYVDNETAGIALHRHHVDRGDRKSEKGVVYRPM
jgi:hypothetical protein